MIEALIPLRFGRSPTGVFPQAVYYEYSGSGLREKVAFVLKDEQFPLNLDRVCHSLARVVSDLAPDGKYFSIIHKPTTKSSIELRSLHKR